MMELKYQTPVRIVIVDDHPNTAMMLARVLTKFDPPVEVLTALTAKEAIEKIADRGVDILITDFMMPEMNGLELIEKLDGEKRPAHIILITAYDTPGLAVAARRLNVKDYLVKPVQPERIRDIVHEVIEELRPPYTNPNQTNYQRTFKILVADDNPDNLRLLSARLSNEGYEFIPAWDGEDTLQIARSIFPDLVLLDVNMPKKDGFQVLKEFRSDPFLNHIPIIIVTAARIGPKDVRDGLTIGADDYVIKPFDWRELAARIHSKLRVKQAEDMLRRKNMELSIFPELSRVLRDHHSVDQMSSALIQRLSEGLGIQNIWLEIFMSDGSIIRRSNQAQISLGDIQKEVELGRRISEAQEKVVSSDKSILIQDSRLIPELNSILNGQPISAAFVPIIGLSKTWGVLSAVEWQADYFTSEHLDLLETLGFFAALAIENEKFQADTQICL